MLRTERKEAVVICGGSGAGKTESTRLLVEFLAAFNMLLKPWISLEYLDFLVHCRQQETPKSRAPDLRIKL